MKKHISTTLGRDTANRLKGADTGDHYFTKEKCENYSFALSDIICWMDGFKAAGGVYHPDSIEVLRELNIAVKQIDDLGSGSESHFRDGKK